ncbi:MAG TPA: DNA methyltransferase, partial [Gammaproteobacteria bacterium]|nr:DNA methyltransferase [Gammaproteobacteria bacterium]
LLPDLLPIYFSGVKTSRDGALVDIDHGALEQRMRQYFNQNVNNEEMRQIAPCLMQNTTGFDFDKTRKQLQKRGFLSKNIVRYVYRPFDVRWLYWEPETKLLDAKRSEYIPHIFKDNLWLASAQKIRRDFDSPVVIKQMGAGHLIERGANLFPMYLKPFHHQSDAQPNLSQAATDYLTHLDADASALFHHIVAILHAPAYRTDNAGALKQDWPRIPLPATREQLLTSAELGQRIAALLDIETPLPGVTQGKPRPELANIALLTILDNTPLTPDHLKITAGWGHVGKGGVTMPGKGKTVKRSLTTGEHPGLSDATLDVYLNANVYWKNVPLPVWEYTMGGYQVIKKWLSYRELELLGRPLLADEALELTWIARRITALILMRPILDKNYVKIQS